VERFLGRVRCLHDRTSGPNTGGCEPFDFNGDDDVDAGDYASFVGVFDGP
jgi:hypothetical protein